VSKDGAKAQIAFVLRYLYSFDFLFHPGTEFNKFSLMRCRQGCNDLNYSITEQTFLQALKLFLNQDALPEDLVISQALREDFEKNTHKAFNI